MSLKSKKIFFWSPMTSNVGTVKATINTAIILNKKTKHEIFLINVLGEFNFYLNNKDNIKIINIFPYLDILPKTGLMSKMSIYFFSIISFPYLFFLVKHKKPDIIYSSLVGFIPLILKIFFQRLKIFNSIQGYPKFNLVRSFLWKIFYSKSDLIICMTNQTKNIIKKKFPHFKKIIKINNPVIDKSILKNSQKKINLKFKKIFDKPTFITMGRLTKQKNFLELLNAFLIYQKKKKKIEANLIILGSGEDFDKLKNFVNDNNLKNIYFLGHQNNPFNFIKKANIYVSSSLWEDPGHALIEASYLRKPIITSNCPSGPLELFNKKNSLLYQCKDIKKLANHLEFCLHKKNQSKLNFKAMQAKKISYKFTHDNFFNSFKKFI